MNFYQYKVLTIIALEHLRKEKHIVINDTGLMFKLNLQVRDYYRLNRNDITKLK
jgi:hypothetical protein